MQKNDITLAEEILTQNTVSISGVEPFLRCLRGEFEGFDIPVLSSGILVGRDPVACQLVFANTPEVSRYHCRVTYSKRTGYFVVTDLNSANGVYTESDQRVGKGEKIALIPDQIFKLCGDLVIFQVIVKKEEL